MTFGRNPLSDNFVCACVCVCACVRALSFHVNMNCRFYQWCDAAGLLKSPTEYMCMYTCVHPGTKRARVSKIKAQCGMNQYFMITKCNGPTWSRLVALSINAEVESWSPIPTDPYRQHLVIVVSGWSICKIQIQIIMEAKIAELAVRCISFTFNTLPETTSAFIYICYMHYG